MLILLKKKYPQKEIDRLDQLKVGQVLRFIDQRNSRALILEIEPAKNSFTYALVRLEKDSEDPKFLISLNSMVFDAHAQNNVVMIMQASGPSIAIAKNLLWHKKQEEDSNTVKDMLAQGESNCNETKFPFLLRVCHTVSSNGVGYPTWEYTKVYNCDILTFSQFAKVVNEIRTHETRSISINGQLIEHVTTVAKVR